MKEEEKIKSMMLVTQEFQGYPTFSLIRISSDCPYIECVFLPEQKNLAIITPIQKDSFHMFPKMDDNGDVMSAKNRKNSDKGYKEERKPIKTYYEFNLVNLEEIVTFVEMFAVNAKTYPFKSFIFPKEK